MAGEAPDVAEIAARIEGARRGRMPKSMGPDDPGQAGGLTQPADNPADRLSSESHAWVWLGSVEAVEERTLFVAPTFEPSDQGGRSRIG